MLRILNTHLSTNKSLHDLFEGSIEDAFKDIINGKVSEDEQRIIRKILGDETWEKYLGQATEG